MIAVVFATISLVACGGGGGGDSAAGQITYFQQGGLTWSSLTAEKHGYQVVDGFKGTPEYICTGATSVNGGPETPDNFNKTAGWRLPSHLELLNLYKEIPKPVGWALDRVWSSEINAIDFSTGVTYYGNGSRAYVTCVK